MTSTYFFKNDFYFNNLLLYNEYKVILIFLPIATSLSIIVYKQHTVSMDNASSASRIICRSNSEEEKKEEDNQEYFFQVNLAQHTHVDPAPVILKVRQPCTVPEDTIGFIMNNGAFLDSRMKSLRLNFHYVNNFHVSTTLSGFTSSQRVALDLNTRVSIPGIMQHGEYARVPSGALNRATVSVRQDYNYSNSSF